MGSINFENLVWDQKQPIDTVVSEKIKERASNDITIKEVEIRFSCVPSMPNIIGMEYVPCIDLTDSFIDAPTNEDVDNDLSNERSPIRVEDDTSKIGKKSTRP